MAYQDPSDQFQGPPEGSHRQPNQGMPGGQPEMVQQPSQGYPTQFQGQPPQGQQQLRETMRPAEADVKTPTLQWVTLSGPRDRIPLGEDDYVLDSIFDVGTGCWEVLVILQPTEAEDEEEEEEDEE